MSQRKHESTEGSILNQEVLDAIVLIQQTITRLDSFFIWNGRSKAQAIQTALDAALETAETKPFTLDEFLDFKSNKSKGGHSMFVFFVVDPMRSIREELSISRHEYFDNWFDHKPLSSELFPKN